MNTFSHQSTEIALYLQSGGGRFDPDQATNSEFPYTAYQELSMTSQTEQHYRTLVLGIGNTLLSDEGVGVHVVNQLFQDNPPSDDICYMDGGTLSFTLAHPIEACDQLIVVDASEIQADPGSVEVFEDQAMDTFITTGNKKSVHEVGLVDVMSIVMLANRLPAKRALVGIQPQNLDWGERPTAEVEAAIPEACERINNLIERWQS